MIPHPPGNLSILRAGNGFAISKNLNTKNPTISLRGLQQKPHMVMRNPTTSSITTSEGSFPSFRSTRVDVREPMKKSATINDRDRYIPGSGSGHIMRAAINVPKVAGAMGKYPVPRKVLIAKLIFSTIGGVLLMMILLQIMFLTTCLMTSFNVSKTPTPVVAIEVKQGRLAMFTFRSSSSTGSISVRSLLLY